MGRHNELVRWYAGDPTQRYVVPGKKQIVALGKNTLHPWIPLATKLTLPGSLPGAGISTPTTAAIDAAMATSWEQRFHLANNHWQSPTQSQMFGGKVMPGSGLSDSSWYFTFFQPTGQLGMNQINTAGTSNAPSYTPPVWVNGSAHWLKFTYDPATGKATGYWSDDNVTYTQMAQQTFALLGTRVSTQPIRVGGVNAADFRCWDGYIQRYEFRSPIGGAILAGFDASLVPAGALSCTGLNGETWTLYGSGAGFS